MSTETAQVTGQLIDGFLKSSRLKVCGVVSEYGGRLLAHLREFASTEGGTWVPTKHGVTVPIEQFEEVCRGVRALAGVTRPAVVAEIHRNPRWQVRVGATSFHGELLYFVRGYYISEDGEWLPSPKGVTIHRGLRNKLEALAKEVQEVISTTTPRELAAGVRASSMASAADKFAGQTRTTQKQRTAKGATAEWWCEPCGKVTKYRFDPGSAIWVCPECGRVATA